MAAPPLSNTFEGGTDTVAITTGNSGGASGNAFDAVVGTLSTFSATQARGALSDQIIQGVTNADTSVGWNSLGSITTDLWGRQYLYLTANPNVAMNVGQVRTSAAAHSSSIFITTGGKVQAKNGAGAAIAASLGIVSVSLNTWVRIEWRIISSTTAGVVEWRLYNVADSLTISDTVTVSSQPLGANSDQVRFGNPSAGPTSITTYHDDVAVSTTGWIGPSGGFIAPGDTQLWSELSGPGVDFGPNPFQEYIYLPGSTDINIAGLPGDLTLSAPASTITETYLPSPGDLTLTAGTQAVKEGISEPVGVLTLQGGSQALTEAMVASGGVLTLGAGTATVTIGGTPVTVTAVPGDILLNAGANADLLSLPSPPGILNLNAGTQVVSEKMVPTPGDLTLGAGGNAPLNTVVHVPGNLTLSAGTQRTTDGVSPSAGTLTLDGVGPTLQGSTEQESLIEKSVRYLLHLF